MSATASVITPAHIEELAREFYEAHPHTSPEGVPLQWLQVDPVVRANLMNAARTVMLRFEGNLRHGVTQVLDHHRQLMGALYEVLTAISQVVNTPTTPEAAPDVLREVRAICQQGLTLGRGVVSA